MSIEELGRSAADAALRKATQEVDPTMMLQRLHRTSAARTVLTAAAVVVALVVAVVVVHGVAWPTSEQPGGRPSTVPSSVGTPACAYPGITCLGGGRFRAALPVPVTLTAPADFDAAGSWHLIGTRSAEGYRSDVDGAGVTVMEGAVPVRNDSSWTRDPAAGSTAASVAQWLADRPFLQNASVVKTRVGLLEAWRVTASLRPGAPLTASKDQFTVGPTFKNDGSTAGFATNLTGDYTVLDVPGAGLTVIWSWTTQPGDRSILDASQDAVDGLAFTTG
jgi:hypothetical protein